MRAVRLSLVFAATTTGVVACGAGSTEPSENAPSVITALTLGTNFTCALTNAGTAYCWGINTHGELGNGSTTASNTPTPVAGNLVFSAISANDNVVCGIVVDGSGYCWGRNFHGELGNGDTVDSHVPVPVSGQLRFAALSVGGAFACGLTTNRVVYCWGYNHLSQLGTSTSYYSKIPVLVATGQLVYRTLSAGIFHTCALTNEGAAYCWGGNQFSQLGDGTSTSPRATPVPVGGGLLFSSIHSGATTTCGMAAGVGYCWGGDLFGSLGQGTTGSRPDAKLPVAVVGGVSFTSVRAGPGNIVFTPGCGLNRSGAAYCWGSNSSGQLGTTATPDTCTFGSSSAGCSGTPLVVSGGHRFLVVVPGGEHACGITSSHSVFCWGANSDGQLGDGTNLNRAAPVAVAGALRTP